MLEFMREGGFAMWVILLFGLGTLALAVAFAVKPRESAVHVLRSASRATLFATLTGLVAGLGAVFHKVPGNPDWAHSPDLHLIVMTGLGESLANAILGFSLLTLAWLAATVGMRRLP